MAAGVVETRSILRGKWFTGAGYSLERRRSPPDFVISFCFRVGFDKRAKDYNSSCVMVYSTKLYSASL